LGVHQILESLTELQIGKICTGVGRFRDTSDAPVLENYVALKRVKINFTVDNFFNLTLLWCTQLLDALVPLYVSSALEYILKKNYNGAPCFERNFVHRCVHV
jgi:hypothetical protein